ncbi:MAG: hypothetical protein ACKO0W_02530, partial [Planctomycetota bacterium]
MNAPDRISELMDRAADRALFGGSPPREEHALAGSLGIDLERETESLELAAAFLAAHAAPARASDDEEMPASLRARLHALAEAHVTAPAPASAPVSPPTPAPQPIPIATARRRVPASVVAAWTVAAASIAVAVASNWSLLADAIRGGDPATTAIDSPEGFLATHPRALRAALTNGGDAHARPDARGEACFDPETGEGVLFIEGLAPNDPAVEQYQLWIFDRTRDERFPVD